VIDTFGDVIQGYQKMKIIDEAKLKTLKIPFEGDVGFENEVKFLV